MRSWMFLLALLSSVLGFGAVAGAEASVTPGLLHQLLTTGAPVWAVEQALEWGADPNVESVFFRGRNALHLAVEYGPVEHVGLVASWVGDLDAVGGPGGTALTLAAQREDWLERLRVLLEAGADPNVIDGRGRHPLLLVASKGDAGGVMSGEAVEGVRLLWGFGVDPSAVLAGGASVLSELLTFGPPVSLLDELLTVGLAADPVLAKESWVVAASAGGDALAPEVAEWLSEIDFDTGAASYAAGEGDGAVEVVGAPGGRLIRE